ncbi:MAG: hypothetical protein GY856_04930, partial [bacterium]|nr:hypothetical protein [bacterium]
MLTTDRSADRPFRRSLIVAAGLILGVAVVGVGAEPQGHQALEEEILQGLSQGHDVRLLLEQMAEIAPPPRGDRTVSGQVTAELAASLTTLHRVLPAAGDAAPSGKQLEQLLAAGERVRAADLLMRAHFGTIRERLEEVGIGGEIFDRLAAAEIAYCDAMDELLGAVEGPLSEIRVLKNRRHAPAAGKAVHGELAAIRERLAVYLVTPPPPILRGGVLPYRPAGMAPRAPRTEPAVVPSYLNPLAEDSTAADLAATPEAPPAAEL